MSEFRRMLCVSIIVTAVAAAMWGLAVDWSVRHDERTAMPLDRAGATAAIVLAGICWVQLWRAVHDRDRSVLIRTLSRTVPMRRIP